MKKFIKKILIISTALSLAAIQTAYADTDHEKSPDEILQTIREEQNLEENDEINCETLNDEQREALGEAVMGLMHPDPEQHEFMDIMMGGEGSETLKTAHRMMGEQYLGCGTAGIMGASMMNMMGGMNMMGSDTSGMMNSDTSGMMGSNTQKTSGFWNNIGGMSMMGSATWFFMPFVWILVIAGLVAFGYFIGKQGKSK